MRLRGGGTPRANQLQAATSDHCYAVANDIAQRGSNGAVGEHGAEGKQWCSGEVMVQWGSNGAEGKYGAEGK